MGGGSSNGATALKALNKIFKLGKTSDELQAYAMQIGMDVPFFLTGGCALGTHFGEIIRPLEYLRLDFEIIDTGIKISSKDAYGGIDVSVCGKDIEKTEKMLVALKNGDTAEVIKNFHNDFESWAYEKYPRLKMLKQKLEKEKNSRVLLAGSGGALINTPSSLAGLS